MSIGDLNTPIQILRLRFGRDRDGFPTESEELIACVRARAEMRNATERWSSRAVLREASAIFTFRYIPHIEVTTDMVIVCGADRNVKFGSCRSARCSISGKSTVNSTDSQNPAEP